MTAPAASPAPAPQPGLQVASPSGLTFDLSSHGSVRRMAWRELCINLYSGNELEGGPDLLVLRRLSTGGVPEWTPLLGPRSPSRVSTTPLGLVAQGEWGALKYTLHLVLSSTEPTWFWHLDLHNSGSGTCQVDVLHGQDVALSPWAALRTNEFYVSHYLDHTPLTHPRVGTVLATRQNLAVAGFNPWLLTGALGRSVAWATDQLQWLGLGQRHGQAPLACTQGLPSTRLQHEHALAALQHEALTLPAGAHAHVGFFGLLQAHHAEASGPADLAWVDHALALAEAACPPSWPPPAGSAPEPVSLFASAPLLAGHELSEAELRGLSEGDWQQVERDDDGTLLSYFQAEAHTVLRAKERQVLRPHGHLLRTGHNLTPDECALTSTCWMGGVFHSMVTQGHVGINRFVGTVRGYLGQFRSQGLRVFVEIAGQWQLLDQPSAFQMRPDSATWWYRHDGGLLSVQAQALSEPHALSLQLQVEEGEPLRCLISLQVALDGDDELDAGRPLWLATPDGALVYPRPDSALGQRFAQGHFRLLALEGTRFNAVGGDELLYPDARSRQQPQLCLVTETARSAGLLITGHLVAGAQPGVAQHSRHLPASPWLSVAPASDTPAAQATQRLALILPWLQHNALVHYLAPRGLEQFSGGGWGTRDVCQGPVELLLALGRPAPIRDLLLRVYSAQNRSGDWPQWFMFFERERGIRAGDSHGDIVYWPLLALGQYLLATGDASLLTEPLPYFEPGEPDTLWQHAQRALQLAAGRTAGGTALAAYGHGDWNDALQPADPALREHMCSSWTVTLHHQVLATLSQALREVAGNTTEADALQAHATRVLADFHRVLVLDGEIMGYALFKPDGAVEPMLHPRDRATGVRHSLLPMMHAIINDMLSPVQAQHHLALIRSHLSGPDGARLFDQPMAYRGGPQTWFQRAESSSYFGREIGLMYTHAHLRYTEALAHMGEAEAFFDALGLAHPVALHERLPQATRRQANCYYSSSDAAFADRAEASAHYDRIASGQVALEGGWRVYSSGAGISLGLVMRQFLGLRPQAAGMVFDPVMPSALDGLQLDVQLGEQRLALLYRVGTVGHGVQQVLLNGEALAFSRVANPYRGGAALVPQASWQQALASTPAGQTPQLQLVLA
ncbi:MAG: hypothetical protein IPJ08_21710 [Burkholderiales bacterium]|nr:hypothetical protein [Burkholderiales bacterium]